MEREIIVFTILKTCLKMHVKYCKTTTLIFHPILSESNLSLVSA